MIKYRPAAGVFDACQPSCVDYINGPVPPVSKSRFTPSYTEEGKENIYNTT